jgi:hypothetical protein
MVVTKEFTKIGSSRPPVPKFGRLTPTVVICELSLGSPISIAAPRVAPPRPPLNPAPLGAERGGISGGFQNDVGNGKKGQCSSGFYLSESEVKVIDNEQRLPLTGTLGDIV